MILFSIFSLSNIDICTQVIKMERYHKRNRLFLGLAQKQVDVLENTVSELKAKNTFLSEKLIQLEHDKSVETKPHSLSDCNTIEDLQALYKHMEELKAKNRFLCEKLAEFQWDEKTEIQNELAALVKRRELALLKAKLHFEFSNKEDGLNAPFRPEQEDSDQGYDEVDN